MTERENIEYSYRKSNFAGVRTLNAKERSCYETGYANAATFTQNTKGERYSEESEKESKKDKKETAAKVEPCPLLKCEGLFLFPFT